MSRQKKVNPGIYLIQLGPKFYVGSATNLSRRASNHLYQLRRNKHENSKMQRAFNKYGECAFSFTVICRVDAIDDLIPHEQVYLDRLFSMCHESIILNINKIAENCTGIKRTPAQIERMRKARTGFRHSEKTKALISEQSKDRNARIVYTGFYDPIGNLYKDVRNLTQFCKKHGIDNQAMHKLMQGKIRHNKGWTLYIPGKDWKPIYPDIISPDGVVYSGIYNMNKFSREHGLSNVLMGKVFRGQLEHYRGWKIYSVL